jgi:hypothetical protein
MAGDDDQQQQRAAVRRDDDGEARRNARLELPGCPGAGEQAHDETEVVAGDVDQVALVDVLALAEAEELAQREAVGTAPIVWTAAPRTMSSLAGLAMTPSSAKLEMTFSSAAEARILLMAGRAGTPRATTGCEAIMS